MKKTLLNNLKFIVLGLIVVIGASYAYAGTWNNPPPCTGMTGDPCPPAHNTETPVNIGTLAQEKGHGSTCDGTGASCGLSIAGAFLANMNAQFDDKLVLSGGVYGDANNVLHVGDAGHRASVAATGRLYTDQSFQSDTLKHDGSGTLPICNDGNGNVILCP